MTRVLLLCEYATLNGGEHSMLAILDEVRRAGFELIAAAPATGPLAEALKSHGVDICPVDFRDQSGVRRPLPALREELSEVIRRVQPRLVHANSLSMSRLVGPVTHAMQVTGLGHLRDIIKLSRQAIADLNLLDRRLAVSEAVRDYHVGQGLTAEQTFVLYNGVDLEQFRPQQPTGRLHRELGLPMSANLLGTIGQICLRKGHDVMARAMRRLAVVGWTSSPSPRKMDGLEVHPTNIIEPLDVHWVIGGERHSGKQESRQFEADLRSLAAEGPLQGRVHFLGYRDDMEAIYSELTMLVHPARQESLGRVLLEAGACGLPIIATDVGGTAEIFPRQSNACRLVPANDDIALADAIRGLLVDPELGSNMGCLARTRIEQSFGRIKTAQGLVHHYRDLLRS